MLEQRLTSSQVMALYGISEQTLCNWKKNYGMPYRQFGRDHFYLESELEEWDQNHRVPRETTVKTRAKSILHRNARVLQGEGQ